MKKNKRKLIRKKIRKKNNKKEKKNFLKKKLNKYKIIILVLFSIFLFIPISHISINKLPISPININNLSNNFTNIEYDIKVCVCTLGKQENRYIREFVSHYEKYGIDKIYLYDNNDINGERFEEVINDYISKGFVEILNWRGRLYQISNIMVDCYTRNKKNYDWLIFYELDEFIHLSNYTNVKPFLKQPKFEKCQLIYLNSICHTDNNKLYYENKSLSERFPERAPMTKHGGKYLVIKSIVRGNITNIGFNNVHLFNSKLINCNGYGNRDKFDKSVSYLSTEPDYTTYYVDHYYSKSTEEFINKLNRGDAFSTSTEYYLHRVEKYFNQSEMTKEKIDMIEKGTGLNLSKFRQQLLDKNRNSL